MDFRRQQQRADTTAITGIIGTVSLALLVLAVPPLLSDYVLFSLVMDGYILSGWRYRIFDASELKPASLTGPSGGRP